MRKPQTPTLPWLEPGEAFPPVARSLGHDSGAPGLLAAGGALDVETLRLAYSCGIFPWFSDGQPILWWSPDPRMVLAVADFRLQPSLRKTLRRAQASERCEVRFDTAFAEVIAQCAEPRAGSGSGSGSGTWILPQMQQAYLALHRAGYAHSVETWIDGELVGGLYCVALGGAVFGESMFSRRSDASKIALAALIVFCQQHAITHIDCQQNTGHLASLGAREMPRRDFLEIVTKAMQLPAPDWKFLPLYWKHLLTATPLQP